VHTLLVSFDNPVIRPRQRNNVYNRTRLVKRPSTLLAQPFPVMPRRRFVQGLAAGGVLAGLSPLIRAAGLPSTGTKPGSAAVLTGTEFNLEIGESPVNFTGNPRMATTVNGSLPAPTLRWREGEDRKSTRLNSSHVKISYAVFCLKKKTRR